MAEEIKRVISVDTSAAAQSIKWWTNEVESSKAKLNELDAGTKEYNATLNRLQKAEQTLTTLQNTYTGSLDQTKETLNNLDNVSVKTFDTMTRGLSEIDQKTGIFGGSLSKIIQVVGTVKTTAVNLFTAVKSGSTTAFGAIKAGIASTGIGLLVLALGQIVAHFDEISKWAKKLFPILRTNTDELAAQEKLLNNQLELMKQQNNWELRLAKARGASESQLLSLQSKQLSNLFTAQKQLVQNLESQGKKGTDEWEKANQQLIEYRVQIAEQDKRVKDYNNSLKVTNSLEKEITKTRAARGTTGGDSISDEQKRYESLMHTIEESSKTEVEKLKEQETEAIALAESLGKETWQIREYYEGLITAAVQREAAKRQKIEEDEFKSESNQISQSVDQRNAVYRERSALITQEAQLEAATVEASTSNQWEKSRKLYEIKQNEAQQQIALIDEMMENEELSDDEVAVLRKKRESLEVKQHNDKKARLEEEKKLSKAAYGAIAGATTDLFGTIAGQLKEGSKAWKAFSIMEATINTIQGALGAYMQAVQSYPPPFGPILGGITAATATASGIMQIAKIKNTKMDGNSDVSASGLSAGGTSVAVSPLLNEARDTQSLESLQIQPDSVSTQQDQRVYVVESDITEAQNRVAVTESNATF